MWRTAVARHTLIVEHPAVIEPEPGSIAPSGAEPAAP